MSDSHSSDVAEVLGRISDWPVEDRIVLAREILQTVERDVSEQAVAKKPLKSLLGVLHLEKAPPSDADCQRILEEELLREYGA